MEVIKYSDYTKVNENWFDDSKKNWSKEYYDLVSSFCEPIFKLVDKLKEDFNNEDDPSSVYDTIVIAINDAFLGLEKEINNIEDKKFVEKFPHDFIKSIDNIKKDVESLKEREKFGGVSKLFITIFDRVKSLVSSNIIDSFLDSVNGVDNIGDKIKVLSDLFKELKNKFVDEIDEIDPEEIFDSIDLEEKNSEEIDYNPGDDVRYTKKDNVENIAMVSKNQEDLEEGKIRLASKADGNTFEIDKTNIVEIIQKELTISQEIKSKIRKIVDNESKMDLLNTYLDKLIDEDE